MEIGLVPVGPLAVVSLIWSLFTIAKNLNQLDQYALSECWSGAEQVRNLAERLVEVSFRVVWLSVFLGVMRPEMALSQSYCKTLVVLLPIDIVATAGTVWWHAPHYPWSWRAFFAILSLVARPPYFLRDLRATEAMLAETMLADLRARAARVCRCMCTGCTTRKIPFRNVTVVS